MTYLPAEARARIDIDSQLEAAGWIVQSRGALNLYAGQGVAVREFTLKDGHGRVDYLLFIERGREHFMWNDIHRVVATWHHIWRNDEGSKFTVNGVWLFNADTGGGRKVRRPFEVP